MRLIEQQMVEAIKASRPWKSGNTEVRIDDPGAIDVLLHGHHIATIGDGFIRWTLAGWNTVTTHSRINALLHEFSRNSVHRVGTRKFMPVYGIVPITATEWIRS